MKLSYVLEQVRKRVPCSVETDRNGRSYLLAPGPQWHQRTGSIAIFHSLERMSIGVVINIGQADSRTLGTFPCDRIDLACTIVQERIHKLLGLDRVECGYCGSVADLFNGMMIYPHRLDLEKVAGYVCPNCSASVGTHKGNFKPLGTLANKRLKALRQEAHRMFDPLWKNGAMSRTGAYQWLQGAMGLSAEQAHIAMLDELQCMELIELLREQSKVEDLSA